MYLHLCDVHTGFGWDDLGTDGVIYAVNLVLRCPFFCRYPVPFGLEVVQVQTMLFDTRKFFRNIRFVDQDGNFLVTFLGTFVVPVTFLVLI